MSVLNVRSYHQSNEGQIDGKLLWRRCCSKWRTTLIIDSLTFEHNSTTRVRLFREWGLQVICDLTIWFVIWLVIWNIDLNHFFKLGYLWFRLVIWFVICPSLLIIGLRIKPHDTCGSIARILSAIAGLSCLKTNRCCGKEPHWTLHFGITMAPQSLRHIFEAMATVIGV